MILSFFVAINNIDQLKTQEDPLYMVSKPVLEKYTINVIIHRGENIIINSTLSHSDTMEIARKMDDIIDIIDLWTLFR